MDNGDGIGRSYGSFGRGKKTHGTLSENRVLGACELRKCFEAAKVSFHRGGVAKVVSHNDDLDGIEKLLVEDDELELEVSGGGVKLS
ncbi:unnamed protein product [Lupinus luteus]|uniref:Uncharacterized protein n=1 Tax=Lupinus luteus TaxID=3873 RepID=A0AAV1XBF4_LUPLU